MSRYEYMKTALDIVPKKIICQYNICALASNGLVYMEICKVIPGLKQAGHITNDHLHLHLSKFGYAPVALTPSLWKHATKNIIFSLVVADFGVKYVGKDNDNLLIQALKKLYTVSINWYSALYCGLSITWYYRCRTCNISMPSYLTEALQKFQHPPRADRTPPMHGKIQFMVQPSSTPTTPMTPPPSAKIHQPHTANHCHLTILCHCR